MEGDDERPPRRVLLVDDSEDARKVLTLLLESGGHAVRASGSGGSALREAAEFRPDVVLLDLRLEDMSGYELAADLRAQAEGEKLLLVAVSGLDGPDVSERCRAAGIDCHVVKPVRDFSRLLELVASLEVDRGTD